MHVQTRLFMAGGTALAIALTVGAGPAEASTPTPPTKALPVALDVQTPYEAQVSCDPRAKPGVTAFTALMRARYQTGSVGTYRPCQSDTSEHYDGRAADWMLSVSNPAQKAVADSVTAWLSARGGVMSRRFGISYIIWNKRMWREYAPERGWTAYTGGDPHTSHVHFSFSWDGAMKRTSWWTGRATTVVDVGPCRVFAGQFAPLYRRLRTVECSRVLGIAAVSPYRVAAFGQSSTQIAVAQRILGVGATGKFGSPTFTQLVAWQARRGTPVTGVLDKATWAKLVPATSAVAVTRPATTAVALTAASRSAASTRYTAYKRVALRNGSTGSTVSVLQRAFKIRADGHFGATTRAAVMTFQARQRLTPNGIVGLKVWNRLEGRDYPLVAYRRVTLRQGSRGVAVVAVQRALRLTADGAFGPRTAATVAVVQRRARLTRTGVVSGWTWVALERWMRR